MEDGFTQGRYISCLALLWKAVGHSQWPLHCDREEGLMLEDGFTQGRYISSLALLWKAVGHSDGRYTVTGRKDSCWRMGSPKVGTSLVSPYSGRPWVTQMAATL